MLKLLSVRTVLLILVIGCALVASSCETSVGVGIGVGYPGTWYGPWTGGYIGGPIYY
jgi:predicted small secreted protein